MSQLNNTDDVYDFIETHMVTLHFRGHPQIFLPRSFLETATHRDVIQKVVSRDARTLLNDSDMAHLIDRAARVGRKLFAICVYCGADMQHLKVLLENGLTDQSLPLKKEQLGSLKDKKQFANNFTKYQGHFNTVVLSRGSIQTLDDRVANLFTIPIQCIETNEYFRGNGAFGTVWKVKIHQDHRTFYVGNPEGTFAMKVTEHVGREQGFHSAMSGLDHSHLVKCLASFTLGPKYQMIYELANCDLEEFIQKNPIASRVAGLSEAWFAQQLAGLAGALEVVHNPNGAGDTNTLSVPSTHSKTGYIHDIKPENILVFVYDGNPCWLRLSDFSCAKVVDFVATISGKRDSYKTGTKSGTPIYRAPESLDGKSSRPYDMWSLGCVYLELLVWFVEGYAALEAFRLSREGHVRLHGVIDEGFYHEPSSGNIELREPVLRKIEDLSRRCSGGLKNLVDAVPSLLRIDPKKRLGASELAGRLGHLDTGSVPEPATDCNASITVPNFVPKSSRSYESDDSNGFIKVTRPSND